MNSFALCLSLYPLPPAPDWACSCPWKFYMSKREQAVSANQENAVLSYIRSSQKPCTDKTRNQIFVVRCHKYGCFDNAG